MINRLAAAIGGIGVVGTGGVVAINYGTSLLGDSKPSKIKIWINDGGSCQSQKRVIQGDEVSDDDPCVKVLTGDLSWDEVEIDEKQMAEKYKTVKTEADFKEKVLDLKNSKGS